MPRGLFPTNTKAKPEKVTRRHRARTFHFQ